LLTRPTAAQQFSKDPVVDRSWRHSIFDGITYRDDRRCGKLFFPRIAFLLTATTAQIGLFASLPP